MAQWQRTFRVADVFHNDAIEDTQKFRLIAQRLRTFEPTLAWLADELENAEDSDDFDQWWDEFYNWADANRVWVQTRDVGHPTLVALLDAANGEA